MKADEPQAQVRDRPERDRYELDTAHGPAIAAYRREDGVLVLAHTVVPPEEEGHGVATRLIAGVLADVRARRLSIVPACPFVAAYLQRHPADRDLVA